MIGDILSQRGISGRFLLVSGPHTFALFGGSLVDALTQLGVVDVELVDENAISFAMGLAERAIDTDVDVIVGLGGGRVIDVAKFASFVSKRVFVSVPTTVANDGLASPVAVLRRENGLPKSLGAKMPDYTFVDIEVITHAPEAHIKAGIGDTLSNYTAIKDWELAELRGRDEVDDYARIMSKCAFDSLMRSGFDRISGGFIEALANSLVLSGVAMDFAGTSRPVSGSEHCFSHALDCYASSQNMHGIQTALGTIAILNLLDEDATELLEYLSRFDVLINPIGLGISEDDFIRCMRAAPGMRPGRYTCLDEIDLSEDRLKVVYKRLVKEL